MKKINKYIGVALIAILLLCGAVKSVKGADLYKVHFCKFYAVCEDNCKENGYHVMTVDQDNEAFIFRMKDENEDLRGKTFILVTKGDNSNITGYIEDKPVNHFDRKPHYIDNLVYRLFDELWTE